MRRNGIPCHAAVAAKRSEALPFVLTIWKHFVPTLASGPQWRPPTRGGESAHPEPVEG